MTRPAKAPCLHRDARGSLNKLPSPASGPQVTEYLPRRAVVGPSVPNFEGDPSLGSRQKGAVPECPKQA